MNRLQEHEAEISKVIRQMLNGEIPETNAAITIYLLQREMISELSKNSI